MTSRSVSLVVLLLMAMSATSEASAQGRYAMVSVDDAYNAYLVDTQSVSGTTTWVIEVSALPQYDTTDKFFYNYVLTRAEFDCMNRRTRALSITQKDTSDKILYTNDRGPAAWTYVQPQTVFEPILSYVCNKTLPPDLTYYESTEAALKKVTEVAHERLKHGS